MAERNEIRVGDKVRFRMGGNTLTGIVVEARGPLGVEGARMFRLAWAPDSEDDPIEFELSETDLEPVSG